MKLCHQLLRLTGEVRWADALEISLFNALSGAMRADGGWWAYFSPLLGQRVPSQVQLPFVGSSCCVVNGPRALTEVPLWALMSRADGCALNLYQPGIYRCGEGENLFLRSCIRLPALRAWGYCVPRGAPNGEGEWYRGAFRLTAGCCGAFFVFHGTTKQ
jgi:hypothetical protein